MRFVWDQRRRQRSLTQPQRLARFRAAIDFRSFLNLEPPQQPSFSFFSPPQSGAPDFRRRRKHRGRCVAAALVGAFVRIPRLFGWPSSSSSSNGSIHQVSQPAAGKRRRRTRDARPFCARARCAPLLRCRDLKLERVGRWKDRANFSAGELKEPMPTDWPEQRAARNPWNFHQQQRRLLLARSQTAHSQPAAAGLTWARPLVYRARRFRGPT